MGFYSNRDGFIIRRLSRFQDDDNQLFVIYVKKSGKISTNFLLVNLIKNYPYLVVLLLLLLLLLLLMFHDESQMFLLLKMSLDCNDLD